MTKKILLVEDDKDLQHVIRQGLSVKNYEISTADNGSEGLKWAEEVKPDLIILDIMMPVMDGYECCERLREMPEFSKTPIIFLTALTDDWDILKGYIKGCDSYLKKPFSLESLITEIDERLS
jgi:two-component system alkaline phosphatase synthesis response regulator PhoP